MTTNKKQFRCTDAESVILRFAKDCIRMGYAIQVLDNEGNVVTSPLRLDGKAAQLLSGMRSKIAA